MVFGLPPTSAALGFWSGAKRRTRDVKNERFVPGTVRSYRRPTDPLVDLLLDEQRTGLSRAFAAVALGGIADRRNLPWNSELVIGVNYRAAVETLTNGISGVLDIL